MKVTISKIIRKILTKLDIPSNRRMENFIQETNKKINKIINESQVENEFLRGEIRRLENKNYIVERDLFETYKLLEFKVWQFNTSTNRMLYELYLDKQKLRKNYNPLVSIIIPVYNGSNFLEQAINCALAQTYKNIEIIVVNDGSTDNGLTKKVADKFKGKIRYYEKENGGVSSALNYGIKKMKGEYFAWLSHDDLIEEDHIKNLVRFVSIEGNEKTIPFAVFKMADEDGTININETIGAQLHCLDYKLSVIKNEHTLLFGEINGGSVFIPKSAFDKYGLFSEEQRITQERDMWSRLIGEYKFVCIPYDTAIIRKHGKQVTSINPNIKKETDAKNLEIIKNLSDDAVKRIAGDKNSLYSLLELFYKYNKNDYMQKQMIKLKNSCRKEKK